MWARRSLVAVTLSLSLGCAVGNIGDPPAGEKVCAPAASQPCQTGNGTGTQMCAADGSRWGACGNLTGCDPGYNLHAGACVANVCTPSASQACQLAVGAGNQTCNSAGS